MVHSVRSAVVRLRGVLVYSAALFLLASPALAQDQSQSASTSAQASSRPPDFMLGRPRGSIGVKGGWFMAGAKSDFYDFVIDQFTIEKKDFNTGFVTLDFGVNVTPRVDITGAIDFSKMNHASEDRDEEELLSNGSRVPIQQTTELSQQAFTAAAKFYLMPRGHSVSRLAWIPNTFVPYVGAGAGMGKHRLRQNGDFVDFQDHHIFTDTFTSEGWSPVVTAFGGTEIQMYKRLMLTLEGRYSWQHAALGSDFVDFAPLDLGGFRFGVGINFAF
jgi:opacity protein-like surface antigen